MNGPKIVATPVTKVPIEMNAITEIKILDQKLGGAFGGPCAVATIDIK